ncbi:C-C motif chemokine 27a [Siniperca chuatsi]|uniref:C-C motif chemokine 27a n=1 Tax=Siniperca chuatsi TaxID=119488 RepID=UPI001CE118B0|nr:C-C motif chemokine 27a [Siniperca chuatsi]
MDLKVASVIVCLCALAITSTEAGIPKCCIRVNRNISVRLLLKVKRWDIQESSSACDINALKLYVKMRKTPICADPMVMSDLERVHKQMKQNKWNAIK